ncbi:hypothetical protein C6P40_000413 [Pichia californica]|uniref:Histone-binding protein RBBP4-like N-terminal domain-containing protein n=1 Tax=Pichia californica TaxID=460514 RepID=A0A9P6WKX8_9ASCO|nr:hypothetical protein C6P42_005468 [[Candida] californica]KAG0688856.1 hypothetical protein C6P40_000413 [[Candida] californica]
MENTQQERYTVWKKNSPLLYTQLQTSSLLWPSLSLDWLPDTTTPQIQSENNFEYDYNHHRLLLSTFSDGINPLESILLTRLNLFDLRSKNFKNLENFDYIPSSNEFTYSLPLPHLKNTKELTKVNPGNEINDIQSLSSNKSSIIDLTDNKIQITSEITSEKEIQIQNQNQNQNQNQKLLSIESSNNKINNSLGLIQKIPHIGDINRIKHCPQNIDLIATASNSGIIRIFDRTKKSNNLEINNNNSNNDDDDINSNIETSDILLKSHNSESWTIDWNLQKPFTLASGSNDGSISIWNLKDQFKSPPKQKFSTLDSKFRFSTCKLDKPEIFLPAHNFGVNEIRWIPDHDSLLISSGEDGICKLWDIRNNLNLPIIQFFENENLVEKKIPLNTVDINPFQTFELITGNSNGCLNFMDIRNPNKIISKINHSQSITSSKYSPHLKNTIATSSVDATVTIWKDQNPVFVHCGHLLSVSDVVWCPSKKGVLASCSYDNSVHIWEPIL